MDKEELVNNIINYLDNNFKNNIAIDDLAKMFYINKYYMMKVFKLYTSITIIDYLNILRILYSTEALFNTDNSILNIALNYGFTNQEYYSEQFNKYIGTSPSIFRKLDLDVKLNKEKRKTLINLKNNCELIRNIRYYLRGNIIMDKELNKILNDIENTLKDTMTEEEYNLHQFEEKQKSELKELKQKFNIQLHDLVSFKEFYNITKYNNDIQKVDETLSDAEQGKQIKKYMLNKENLYLDYQQYVINQLKREIEFLEYGLDSTNKFVSKLNEIDDAKLNKIVDDKELFYKEFYEDSTKDDK